MKNLQVPEARYDGLVIQEWPEEVLVYDLNNNKAHCLNETAMFVWKSCDGKNSISEITGLLEEHFGQKVNEEIVWLAIDQLLENDLLNGKVESGLKKQSRREIIKKIGLGTVVAIPVVASLVAPTSVQSQSACLCPMGVGPSGDAQCMNQSAAGCGATCNASGVCV